MPGKFDSPAESRGKRICYSCGNSYPDIFRFCPRDSTDLAYLPPPIENLARDFSRSHKWVAFSFISALGLILAAWLIIDQLSIMPAGSAPGYGELTVRTTPPGARVYLDGSQVGVSPVRLSDVPTGFHRVRAVCPGYSDGNANVEILPSATQKLVWDLSPLPSRKANSRNKYLTELFTRQIAPPGETPGGTST